MTTVEWPNPCGGRCHEPLGLVSDMELVVDPSNGEMRHYACADPLLIADDDQKEGRWLRRLADLKRGEITVFRDTVNRRSRALEEDLQALLMRTDLPFDRLTEESKALEKELEALDAEAEALRTYQHARR